MGQIVNFPDQIEWWEPYGYTVRRYFRDLREQRALRPAMWIAIFLAGLAVSGIGILISLQWVPASSLRWGLFAFIAVGGPFFWGICILQGAIVPRQLTIRREWVQINSSQSVRYPCVRVLGALISEESGVPVVVFDVLSFKGKRHSRTHAIAAHVDRASLKVLLGQLVNEGQDQRRFTPPPMGES